MGIVRRTINTISLAGGLLLAGCLTLVIVAADDRPARQPAPPDPAWQARAACETFVERQLLDPRSARWGWDRDWPAMLTADGTWTVLPRVRATNAFGAIIQAEYRCKVRIDGDTVRLVSLDQLSP